jgi:hypothetical protein
MKWWLKIMMLLVAMGILYISFVMASLNRVIDDEKFDRLRKIQITYIDSKGEESCYKLPESRVLPNNIFYPIKELRDNLWVYFSRDKIDKLRILLLVRDKKIEEVLLLKENGFNEKIIDAQMKKIKKISDELNVNLINSNRLENKEIQQRIEKANEFYKFISEKFYKWERIEKCYE